MRIKQKPKNYSWDDLIKTFLRLLLKKDLTRQTIIAYQNDLKTFFCWIEAFNLAKTLQFLSQIDIIEYRQYLLSHKGLKASTINRRLGTLKQFCLWAYKEKILPENITQEIKLVNVSKRRSPLGLKPKEVQALLQASGLSKHGHSKRNYALLHLMLQTGLRVNEVVALEGRDIDIKERSGIVRVRLGKGRKQREVPLNSKARRALQLHLSKRELEENEALFISERGERLSVRAIQTIIQGLSKRANISRIQVSPHTLRHTFALNFLKQNPGAIVDLANLMGHDSIDTTAIYTQPSIEDLALSVEKFDHI